MEIQYTIILILIPVIILSWILPQKWSLLPMIIATIILFLSISPSSLVILTAITFSSYFGLKLIKNINIALFFLLAQAVFLFVVFKMNLNFIGFQTNIIPLGLSYYLFRMIHYIIEVYKKKSPNHTFLDYLNYLFFLPTLLIGPINRFDVFIVDYRRRRWNSIWFSKGLERILFGFAKVILLGNYLFTSKTNYVLQSISDDDHWLKAYVKMVSFFGNAYVQFAGYSDIAIGLSLLMGFRVAENFNSPFLAKNISDFWRRWHITLSDWCKDYVFLPLLAISRNNLISIAFSMLVLALWHEISFRYIIWGLSHAIAIAIWNYYEKTIFYQKLQKSKYLHEILSRFVTLHFVMLSFILVSEKNLNQSLEQFKILFFL